MLNNYTKFITCNFSKIHPEFLPSRRRESSASAARTDIVINSRRNIYILRTLTIFREMQKLVLTTLVIFQEMQKYIAI